MRTVLQQDRFLRSDEEWKTLSRTAAVVVKRLKYVEIPRAVDTAEAADGGDPVHRYVYGESESAWSRRQRVLNMHMSLFETVRKRLAFTIDRGDAMVSCLPPGKQPPEKGAAYILSAIMKFAERSLSALAPKENKKRYNEFVGKYRAAMKEAFGGNDGELQMVNLSALCTHPSKQRRGYGTALVKFITDKADALACPTYLCSSNIDNTTFYEQCGFITVAKFTLGDTNPAWHAPPVLVLMMMRPYVPEHTDEKN
ncbi:hypothetical protein B0H21DRAFT_734162 [Amylocystis lapponica]|nr:hypothetical protein B0H21DRAFT_734162 [Amylocystis lapponica]